MIVAQLLQRLEISFWIVCVKVMKNRRALRLLSLAAALAVVLACSALSFAAARMIAPAESSALQPQTQPTSQTTETASNGQKNTLVLLVDRQDKPKPALRSAWLIVGHPTKLELFFLPLYPLQDNPGQAWNKKVEELFYLTPDGAPSNGFEALIQSRQVWWDHYIVLDEAALAELYSWSMHGDKAHNFSSGASSFSLTWLPINWDRPQTALAGQAYLGAGICRQSSERAQDTTPDAIWNFVSDRLYTDFSADAIQSMWMVVLQQGGKVVCEFPTLDEAQSFATDH